MAEGYRCSEGNVSAPGPSAPSLVDLAHAAEQAIARYVDAVDKAARLVGTDAWEAPVDARVSAALSLFYLRMDSGRLLSDAAKDEIAQMEAMVREYGVRPAWGLRVVAIATRASGYTYCGYCDKRGVDLDGDGRHVVCGRKAASDG